MNDSDADASLEADHEVVIIGAGMSGLCMGIKLLERGIENFLIVEKSPGVGGTWYDNTYPGACCDVPSVLYSYSFAPNPDWSRVNSPHNEIKAYFEDCAQRFDLGSRLRLNTAVTRADWREEHGYWELRLADGETLTCRALVSGLGQLNRPSIPDFPGRDDFAGHSFHSARWDHDYDLRGKRVAIIGSAASALQFVPHVAQQAKQLYVYQRSANFIVERKDRPYEAREKRMFRRFPITRKLLRLYVYLCGEGLLYPVLRKRSKWILRLWEKRCDAYRKAEIPDPALRAKLTPDYRLGCKRILFSDDYYASFRRESVELVTSPIAAIGSEGVATVDGAARPVDVIIYGTGFNTSAMHSAVDFYGEDGLFLQDAWRDGAEAYRGVCAAGFPNFFMLYGPNTNLASNSIIYMVERQVAYAVNCIDKLLKHRLRALAINPRVLRAYNQRMQGELAQTVWVTDCDSWYKNAAGKVVNNWPRSTLAYWWHMRSPDFADFDMRD